MIKGLYAAASAMIAGLVRQEALSHNVANLDTPGFKQVLVSLDDYKRVQVHRSLRGPFGAEGLERVGELGLGVEAVDGLTSFEAGTLMLTGQPLDLAIQGEGFFTVRTPDGDRYTRDGRFLVDEARQLVSVDGFLVLDDEGDPITLPEGQVVVEADGTISVEGTTVARLGLAVFDDPPTQLAREGNNTFRALEPPGEGAPGEVRQGYLEASNVNVAEAMTQMVAVARAYEAAQQLVRVQDELLGQAIARLGRA